MNLHLVSFSIPYPADYGGAVDVFYKIKALTEAGAKIHLHCFQYDREPAKELEKFCAKIDYYPRKKSLPGFFSTLPFIVSTRKSKLLLERISEDDFPVLFEGLHTCNYLNHPLLKNKTKMVRAHNIEHHYYKNLYRTETNFLNKLYFLSESIKLKYFENNLFSADHILAISGQERQYFKENFPDQKVAYIPAFHPNEKVNTCPGKGDYILYHGNLEVPENHAAARYLIENVFNRISQPVIIAGKNPGKKLFRLSRDFPHIRIIANPSADKLECLLRDAHINILFSFFTSGIKLKLINAIFNGRHCLVNPAMVEGTELHTLCEVANTPEEFQRKILELADQRFTEDKINARKSLLDALYSNQVNAKKIVRLLSY